MPAWSNQKLTDEVIALKKSLAVTNNNLAATDANVANIHSSLNSLIVSFNELNQYVSEIDARVDILENTEEPIPPVPPIDPPITEPPLPVPPSGLTNSGTVVLGTDFTTISGKNINGIIGIEGPLNKSVNCEVYDSVVTGQEYATIISHGRYVSLRSSYRATGGIDNCYGIRIWSDGRAIRLLGDPTDHKRCYIENRPGFKCLLRLSNYTENLPSEIGYMKLVGAGSWLGGGPSVQSSDMPQTGPMWIHDIDYYLVAGDKKHAFELYENTHHHTFERCNFWLLKDAAYDVFSSWSDKAGCHSHIARNCKVGICDVNLNVVSALRPLAWSDFAGGQAKHGTKWQIINT